MILRRRALGDVVLVGAITARLPRPVIVQTEARYHSVVERMTGVDEVRGWDQPIERGHRVVDLQRTWRPGAAQVRKHSVARRLRLLGIGRGRPEVTALYASAAGVRPSPPPWIDLARDLATDTLVLLPGASTALKRVPPALLEAVAATWSGPVAALGGPGDGPALASLSSVSESVEDHGFAETFSTLRRARVALGGDSGLSHLAAACGVPTVVVAGPTHPDDGFLGAHFARVVDRALSCRPCTLHRGTRCRRGDRPCFDVGAMRVIAAVHACAG